MQFATHHSPLSTLFLAAVVLPAKEAWRYVVEAARRVNGNGIPLSGRGRRPPVIGIPLYRVKYSGSVAKNGTATFTIYDSDWSTELGELECVVELGAYTANARAYAARIGDTWCVFVRECEVSP